MKANEAPEKIYIPMSRHWYGIDSLFYPVRQHKNDTEYVRTDAFIERAVEYMITHIPDMHILGDSAKIDECIIKEFTNYMKGE